MAQGPKCRILHDRSMQSNRQLTVTFVSVNIHCLFRCLVFTCLIDRAMAPRNAVFEIPLPRSCVPRPLNYTCQLSSTSASDLGALGF